jgi:hypothetical protein
MPGSRRSRAALVLTLLVVVVGAGAILAAPGSAHAARIPVACTGSSGDASRLQSRIDASAAGDEIVISKTCSLTATITLLGGRSYRGDSRSTTLRAARGSNLAAVLASDSWALNTTYTGEPVTIRDLTIDANRAHNPHGGDGMIIRSWQTTIDNVTISNARGNGLRITSRSRRGVDLSTSQDHTQVNGTIRNLFVTSSGRHGIYVEDKVGAVTDWNLLDSWIASSRLDGIRSENAAGWTIAGNHIYDVGASAIDTDQLFGTSIRDNYVEDFNAAGITTTVQGEAASSISGNRVFHFRGSGSTYIAVSRVNYGAGQISLVGNVIRGDGSGTGFSFKTGGRSLTVTSAGNQVTGVTVMRARGSGVSVTSGI